MLRTHLPIVLALALTGACAVADDQAPEVSTETSALVTPVPSMDGLPGFYTRVPPLGAAPGEVLTLWLHGQTNPDGTTSDGTYARTLAPFYEIETGGYHAIPNNPAIGFAAIAFTDDENGNFDGYIVDGILRDLAGRIVTLQLRQLLPDNEVGLPFLMQRLF